MGIYFRSNGFRPDMKAEGYDRLFEHFCGRFEPISESGSANRILCDLQNAIGDLRRDNFDLEGDAFDRFARAWTDAARFATAIGTTRRPAASRLH